ncbi:glycosyltransferase family 4 protein [Candidatus Microgenomates bacterium]|nr:glycosyltransferase family 4 protein [Candidatus Microgenomates bacterium]
MKSQKLKVFIDDKPLSTGHAFRGIGNYTSNLLAELQKNSEVELVNSPKLADLMHYPYFDFFFNTLNIFNKPTVVTIFDTIPLIYPNHYPSGVKGRINLLLQKRKLKQVDAVITISETSKKDIVRFLNISPEKIHPIYLAASSNFKTKIDNKWKEGIRQKYNLPEKFILYVGDINYNKNIEGLIRAFAKIKDSLPDFKLLLIGKSFLDHSLTETKSIFQLIKGLNLEEKIMMLGFISTEDLVYIYNLASVYCQSSFYEGFGLPILEAMACSCPVVAAKTQALVEIAGNAAYFVDPKNTSDMGNGLVSIIRNDMLRRQLVIKGLARNKDFSWKKTAKETVNLYKSL